MIILSNYHLMCEDVLHIYIECKDAITIVAEFGIEIKQFIHQIISPHGTTLRAFNHNNSKKKKQKKHKYQMQMQINNVSATKKKQINSAVQIIGWNNTEKRGINKKKKYNFTIISHLDIGHGASTDFHSCFWSVAITKAIKHQRICENECCDQQPQIEQRSVIQTDDHFHIFIIASQFIVC